MLLKDKVITDTKFALPALLYGKNMYSQYKFCN